MTQDLELEDIHVDILQDVLVQRFNVPRDLAMIAAWWTYYGGSPLGGWRAYLRTFRLPQPRGTDAHDRDRRCCHVTISNEDFQKVMDHCAYNMQHRRFEGSKRLVKSKGRKSAHF